MIREKLAEYAHEAWAGWMQYLFSKSKYNADGTLTIPKWAVQRWERQMATRYKDLPEEEKKSDRDEADKMLDIHPLPTEGVSVLSPEELSEKFGRDPCRSCDSAGSSECVTCEKILPNTTKEMSNVIVMPGVNVKERHVCSVCSIRFEWSDGCEWYGDFDENTCIKFCSQKCKTVHLTTEQGD